MVTLWVEGKGEDIQHIASVKFPLFVFLLISFPLTMQHSVAETGCHGISLICIFNGHGNRVNLERKKFTEEDTVKQMQRENK